MKTIEEKAKECGWKLCDTPPEYDRVWWHPDLDDGDTVTFEQLEELLK